MKGNLTVEASYILPLCLFMIAILGQLGIYQYDREVLKLTGYECILKTVEDVDVTEETMKQNLEKRALENAMARLVGIKDLKVDAKITVSKILLTFQGVHCIFDSPLEVKIVYERVSPEVTLRMTRDVIGE